MKRQNHNVGLVGKLVFCCMAALSGTGAMAQQGDANPLAQLGWSLALNSYATAAFCARKRFSYTEGDVDVLKKIAVEMSGEMDPAQVNEDWGNVVLALQFDPPTAARCFDAYEKETFMGPGPFGF